MIALKLSRIISGKANVRDHWDDIAGYAKLAARSCGGDSQLFRAIERANRGETVEYDPTDKSA